MHANAPDPRKQKWHELLVHSGFFFGAVLFHLILFLMVATWVIWKAPPPPPTDEFHAVAVQVPPPPPAPPPPPSAAAANPQMEPQPVTVPVATPRSTITSFNNNFTVDTSKVLDQALSHLPQQQAPQGTGLGGLGSGSGTGFGSDTGTSAQLAGYFFDMKQASDRKPTGMNPGKWAALLSKYVDAHWDESMLTPFYKSKSPLYTDRFAISTRKSEEAPKAFHLEGEVKPAMWAVHYHGKVSAPAEGDYRFAGFGDDVLAVKIDGQLVLDAGWDPMTRDDSLHKPYPVNWSPVYLAHDKTGRRGSYKLGRVFHVRAGDPVDLDVLIGDEGGWCAFYLMIMKVDNTYETLPDGTPKLPFFQLDNRSVPSFGAKEEHPPFSITPEPWQGAGK